MEYLSSFLELCLFVVCFYLGILLITRQQNLLGVGYFSVGITAFLGMIEYGGFPEFIWIHDFMTYFSKIIATPLMGLGIIRLIKPHKTTYYTIGIAYLIGLLITYFLIAFKPEWLDWISTLVGSLLIIGLAYLAYNLWPKKPLLAFAALTAIGILISVGLLKPSIDLLHILLIAAYCLIFIVVNKSRSIFI